MNNVKRLQEIAERLTMYINAYEVADWYKDNGLSEEVPAEVAFEMAVEYSQEKETLLTIIHKTPSDRDLLKTCFDVLSGIETKTNTKKQLVQALGDRLDLF